MKTQNRNYLIDNSKGLLIFLVVLGHSLEFIRNHDVSVMVFHPGYLDQYILTHSSFTLIRAMECDFLCSSWLKDWLKEYQIELTDFRKVKNA